MHPAGSLIYFTVASGFGFGVLAFLGLGLPVVRGQAAFWAYFLGYALAVTGLLASVLHLGNKINAVKALSQWRSSWLSREGICAIATLLLLAPVAMTQIWGGPDLGVLGYVAGGLCLATVYCTAMIYGQLKTVPRWYQPLTPVLFLTYAATGGALLAQQTPLATGLTAVLIGVQIAHWQLGDRAWAQGADSRESATGLGGAGGRVRLLERPHTGKSYLTREMVHMVGRKHAQRLRGLVILSLALTLAGTVLGGGSLQWAWVAPLILATLVSRWLFFAEAEHVVGLYYERSKPG